ncbi:hypothetical protein TYRP_021259, partial [Tyrophagus putrescentiae]
ICFALLLPFFEVEAKIINV